MELLVMDGFWERGHPCPVDGLHLYTYQQRGGERLHMKLEGDSDGRRGRKWSGGIGGVDFTKRYSMLVQNSQATKKMNSENTVAEPMILVLNYT